ncbi:MAG: FecR domain-containing protein [Parvibaculaceae bacterium]
MRIRSIGLLSAACAGAMAASGAGHAQTASGTAVAVIQATQVAGATGSRVLQINAPVYSGDRVNTDQIGEAQIRFRDDTRLVVGPNSSLVIDRYVFNPDNSTKAVSVNFAKGAFRFISGTSDSRAYSVRTPTATIGIRGTGFDCAVSLAFGTACVITEGVMDFCDVQGRCLRLDGGQCGAAIAPPGQPVQRVSGDSQKVNLLQSRFPYILAQSGLRQDFQLNIAACGLTPTQQQPGQPVQQQGQIQGPPNIAPIVGIAAIMAGVVVVPLAISNNNDSPPVSP